MFEKFEIKLNILKKKINKQFLGIIMFMGFAAIAIFAMQMLINYKNEKQKAQNLFNKSLYEMVSFVNNMENDLNKVQLTNTVKYTATTLADIWKQANLAKSSLETLPVEQNAMEKASKYLTQVSDFSYVLMKKVVTGEKISDDEYTDIKELYSEAKQLNSIMINIYDDLNSARIKWDELEKIGNKDLADLKTNETTSSISKIGKNFQDYEGLIYDGAFSDHLLTQTPKNLPDKEVTKEEANDYLTQVFGKYNIDYIKFIEESKGRVDLYNFEIKIKENNDIKNVSVTKKGCQMYLMVGDRKVSEDELPMDEAKQKAYEFLKTIGIENVKDTYYLKVENFAIINFAATQDNVILYPDLIKVKVALDNGEICSVETQGYTFNHINRENLKPKISLEDAKKSLNKNINVTSSSLAVIPTESNGEVLTYEFKGKINEDEYLIYINATTAEEENILLIVDTPGGQLTM